MKKLQHIFAFSALAVSSAVFAAPMPNTIVVQDKAVVPVLKTEVIRRAPGQEPVRKVEATVFEVTNKGKDIVAREIELQDNQDQFSEKQLSIPVVKQGSVIVPTSKIELNKTVKQDGEVISQSKHIDAEGVQFKKGQAPVKRGLELNQISAPDGKAKVSHAVVTENGAVSRDIAVLEETE